MQDLKRAIDLLARQCNGAITADDLGFAGPDVKKGHMLAWLPGAMWSPGMLADAWVLAQKYEKQIRKHGGFFPLQPQVSNNRNYRTAGVVDGTVVLLFPYDDYAKLKSELIAIPSAHFVNSDPAAPWKKHWSVKQISGVRAKLIHFLELNSFHIDPSIHAWLAAAENVQVTWPVRFVVEASVVEVYFAREDVNTLNAIRAIPGRRFVPATDGMKPHWTIPVTIDACGALIQLLASLTNYTIEGDRNIIALKANMATQRATRRLELDEATHTAYLFLGDQRTEDNQYMVGAIKKLYGAKFERHPDWGQRWRVPVTPMTLDDLILVADKYAFESPPHFADRMKLWMRDFFKRLEASRAEESDFNVTGLAGELRPYQRAGVEYAIQVERAILGDAPGVGKTAQGIAYIARVNQYPALILCPPNLVLNWKKELTYWLPNKSVSILEGFKPKEKDYEADIIVCSYSILSARVNAGLCDILNIHGCDVVVADESHYLSNYETKLQTKVDPQTGVETEMREYKTQRTRAAKAVMFGRRYRLLMTGTAIRKNPIGFAPQLDMLDMLDYFGGFFSFSKHFAGAFPGPHGWTWKGKPKKENVEKLNWWLRGTCYMRRTKDQTLKGLKPKQISDVRLPMSNMKDYKEAEKSIVWWLAEQAVADKTFQESIRDFDKPTQDRLTKEHKEEAVVQARRAEQFKKISTLRDLIMKGKFEAVCEWIQDFLESGEKLVVFAHHRWVQDALFERFPTAARIRGKSDMKPAVLEANKERFQTDPDCQLIIASEEAGSEGHTLTAASNVAIVELPWTPSQAEQMEDRCHRSGQTAVKVDAEGKEYSVTAWYLLSDQTIDMEFFWGLQEARVIMEAAIDGSDDDKDDVQTIMNRILQRLTNASKK